MTVTATRLSPQLLEVRISYERTDEVSTFFLGSDIHLDNPKCNRQLLAKHLNQIDRKSVV
jgi:hypothetical protein